MNNKTSIEFQLESFFDGMIRFLTHLKKPALLIVVFCNRT